MFPELINLGPVTIHTYGFFLAVGAALGLWVLGRLAVSSGLNPDRAGNLALIVLVAGLLGSRVVFAALEWESFAGQPWRLIRFWEGGLVFYGGIAAAIPLGLYFMKRWDMPVFKLLDCFAPALALGQAFGRLGCFSAGCCYGQAYDGWCAVTFTDPKTLAPPGIPLHPTQLYSSLELFVIFGLLMLLWARRKFAGQIFFIYGLLHGVSRVIIEQLRGDYRGEPLLGDLTSTAVFALCFALASAAGLLYFYLRSKKEGEHGIS